MKINIVMKHYTRYSSNLTYKYHLFHMHILQQNISRHPHFYTLENTALSEELLMNKSIMVMPNGPYPTPLKLTDQPTVMIHVPMEV